MRLSLLQILGIAITAQVSWSAPVNAQIMEKRISVEFINQKIELAIKTIASQADIRLVYNSQVWKNSGTYSGVFNNVKLKDVLGKLTDAGNLTYEVINDQFIVIRGKPVVPDNNLQFIPGNTIPDPGKETKAGYVVSGTITNENNEPFPGVSVRVKEGHQAVITNGKGDFMIGVSLPGAILEFTYIGYKTVEKVVNEGDVINLKMSPDPAKLDEVVIIGYGTTTRRLSTGNQSGLSAKEIEKQPVTNVLQTLQGRLPGVFITQTNGLPGAGMNVQIRGANSLTKSNLPFYVIDGVPYLSEPVSAAATGSPVTSAEGATSPMNLLNPADIENIEVLKDADATAIYGSRAANGVVLISTKRGKAGKTKFGMNVSTGMSKVAHFVDLLGTPQYLALREKGYANNGVTPTQTTAPDLLVWDRQAYTDFPRLLMGNTAHTYDATANVSGGDARTNFYFSGTYHKETNIYPGAQGYIRGGVKLNLNHSSVDQRFSLGLSSMYTADKNNISTTDLATYAYNLPPNYPLHNPDGSLYWASGFNNPLGYLNQTNDNRGSNFLSSLNVKYSIIKGLDIKTSIGYSKTDLRNTTLRPMSSLNPLFVVNNSGTASFSYNYTNNYIVEPQITYTSPLWKGTLSILAGGSWQYKQSNQPYSVTATGFLSDEFISNIGSATTRTVSSASAEFKYTSLFGRANYNVQNRYIANFTFRRDGSSRFGPNRRFGNFGSAGAAWIFSEESFVKDKIKWFSFGKLRGSYGVVGNDEIGNYQYLDTYTSSTYVYNGSAGLQPTRIANNQYRWETTKKLEGGIELGFLQDRLSLTAAVYRNRTAGQLINFTVSPQTGFSGFQSNLPATVQNSGMEFLVNSTNVRNKQFTWTSSLNISRNRNKLLSFDNIKKTSYYSRFIVGNPISSYYLYHYNGIDKTTGLPTYTDFNGSGTTNFGFAATGAGDQQYAGTSYPNYYGGLTNSLTYKELSLDFTFQFVKQRGRSLFTSSFYPPGYSYNAAASVMNDYLALGSQDQLVTAVTSTTAGRAAYIAYSNYTASDATLTDASFIRLKNVSLSYNIPAKWISKGSGGSIRVYLQGQNLFTITGYEGYDPESQGVVTPPLRTIIAGLQCTL